MKTALLYGFIMTIISTLVVYSLYFSGFHDSVEKLGTAQIIGSVVGLLNGVACLTLGIRARRSEIPETEPFGYGRALGAGTLIALWGSLFGAISHVLYVSVINPDFQNVIVQGELAKMEARGMTSAQIEQAEGMVRMMTGPVMQGVLGLIMGFIFTFVLALIIAAFLKRTESTVPPVVPA